MSLFVQRGPQTGNEAADTVVDTAAQAAEDFSLFRDKPAEAGAPEAAETPRSKKRLAFFGKRAKGDASAHAAGSAPVADAVDVEARTVTENPEPEAAPAPAPTTEPKKRFGLKRTKKPAVTATAAAEPAAGKRKLKIPKHQSVPIQVVIGYLPEVQARDAREYALGIAEKHFQQLGITFYEVFEYDGGFVFELHEGGDGKAFVPAILNYFNSQGPYHPEEHVSAVLKTAQRRVEVVRMRQGLTALLLPESADTPLSDWLVATKAMTPVVNRQKKFFAFGAGFFAVSALACVVTGLFFRIQGYLPPVAPKVETINAEDLPRSQWKRIEALPPEASVKALRFKSGKWQDVELNQDVEEPEAATEGPSPADAGQVNSRGTTVQTAPVGSNLAVGAKR